MGEKISGSYSKKDISELYAAIGRCMFAIGRFGDALLNLEASQKWYPYNTNSQGLIDNLKRITTVHSHPSNRKVVEKKDSAEFIRNRVTLLMVTNFTRKLVKYRELAPPSTDLISATYGSLIDVFGTVLTECPKIMCYDADNRKEGNSDLYLAALDYFCRKYRFNLQVFYKNGLLGILQKVVPFITTPYIFLLEHDWFFEPQPISLRKIVTVLDQRNSIHLIRFNKRQNLVEGFDFIIEKETRIKEIPLLRTSAHSNNPCLIRTRTLSDLWLPICMQDSFFASQDIRGTPLGVEEALMKSHISSIRNDGFSKAHSRMGTYIFGDVGDSQRIIHLGE
jgi:hypothetical protein